MTIDPKDCVISTWSSAKTSGWFVGVTSGVKITHIPTGISACSDSERSQYANSQKAMDKLTAALENAKPDLTLPAKWMTKYHVAGNEYHDANSADLDPQTTPGYLIRSPRVNGVASNTFVWAGADNPAERLLYLILSTHNTIETE